MPIYDFECLKCNNVYSEKVSFENTTFKGVECPCGCKRKKRVNIVENMVSQGITFGNPVGTDVWNNNHDYRFKHNLPKVLNERANAEKKSHMGTNPYNSIDDVSSGKNFGTSK